MSTSALPRLKLFVWILLIPTYNSGIEQYFNYTKHFERKKKVGGVAYKCGKIASVSSDLLYFGMSAWFFFWGGGGLYYSISHNSSFWKTRNRQRWLQQDPPCLDCHLLLFFGLENDFIYIQNMDQWDTSTLDFSFGWTGASFSPFTDWFQHIWFEVKGMKKRRMNRQDRYIDRHPDRMDSLVKEHLCHTTSHTVEVDG